MTVTRECTLDKRDNTVHRQGVAFATMPRSLILYVLPVLSGAAGLILEVLWMKELGVLFGNTAQAAGATLFVFFLGLVLGGSLWGRRSACVARPLRLYGILEFGVGASALGFLGLIWIYRHSYDAIFDGLGSGVGLIAKIWLASAILLLPAFLMGGTLPALTECLARAPERASRVGSLLYAVNTAGAALGGLLAGFFLPQHFGFRGAYLIAVTISCSAGLAAILIDRLTPELHRQAWSPQPVEVRDTQSSPAPRALAVLTVAFLSGFVSLGLQVLWTRLLAQVLNNSVYAFAAILVTYLVALAIGAFLVALMTRRTTMTIGMFGWALGLSGIAVLASSPALVFLTNGLSVLSVGSSWPHYIVSIFLACGTLLFVPTVLLGMVLPTLFGSSTDGWRAPGDRMGRLLATNALGAMTGALLAGFVLLEILGYWGSLRFMATLYLLLGVAALLRATGSSALTRIGGGGLFVVVALAGIPGRRPTVRLGQGERLVETIEGSAGTVTVTKSGDNLVMRLNNGYVLGDSRSADVERVQAHIPLLLHPAPATVFFLGMGTGLTAAAALDHPVSRVVVTELLPEVARAARTHFAPWAPGLFDDPRVLIATDDGRSYLAGKRDRYDVIISDLFTPWHAGTASLYAVEHFRTARDRLRAGGIFAQWLALHQMSRQEFLIIARTMQAVFPQVTVWRGNFSATQPIVALVARGTDAPLDNSVVQRNVARLGGRAFGYRPGQDHMAGLFYVGNLAGLSAHLATLPLNTDDRPIIEYQSPRTRAEGGGGFVGDELARFFEQLLTATPPARDRFLAQFPARELQYVRSGLEFYRFHDYSARNQPDSARAALDRFRSVVRAREPHAGPGWGSALGRDGY